MFGRSFKRYLEKRDEEFHRRDEELRTEAQQRDEELKAEARKRDEELKAEARKRDAEGSARWARLEELRAKSDAQTEETREFNREILLRNEKVYTRLIAEIEDQRKQIQANTQAVLSVLDRFNGSSA
jgi:hypothetical protein